MSETKTTDPAVELLSAGKKTAAKATASEMLSITGFRERIAERQENHYEPHNAELADSQLPGRVAALFACVQRAKAKAPQQ